MGGSIPFVTIIVAAILLVWSIVITTLTIKLSKKLKTFMVGKSAASLEDTLSWLTAKSASVDGTLDAHKEALEMINSRVKRSIRGYSLVRYNAYGDMGADQSFASSLIDENQDGYILSVITNRNHVGIYAKKINRGTPEVSLTEEENDSLQEAKKSLIL